MTKESKSLASMAAKFNTIAAPETSPAALVDTPAAVKRGRPPKKLKEKKVTIVMPPDVFAAMCHEAVQRKSTGAEGATNSAVVADALRHYCRKHLKESA